MRLRSAKELAESRKIPGKYRCSLCRKYKPVAHFQHYKGQAGGQCVDCRREGQQLKRRKEGIQQRPKSYITEMGKFCVSCKQVCHFEDFPVVARGLAGLGAFCRACFLERYRSSKEYKREQVAKYREKNRERCLAAHRIHQFNRNHKVRICSDGTVTDAFLKKLLSNRECFYCQKFVERDSRTIDHKTPLSRGGAHSAYNLVMACWSCNCSKADKTAEEFLVYRRKQA